MPGPSPFADDWRECLSTHYQYTLRKQDTVTERTLTDVMRRIGFSDQQLAELRVLATMRAEDMPPDYVPDMELLNMLAQAENAPSPESFQITVPDMPEALAPAIEELLEESAMPDEVLQEEIVAEVEVLELVEDEPEAPSKDSPVQFLMF